MSPSGGWSAQRPRTSQCWRPSKPRQSWRPPMQPPDTHDEDPPNPRHSIDPLVSALPLSTPNRRGGLQPYQAPFKGSIDRPVFGPEHLRPLSEVVPTSVPFLDTATQMQ